MSRKKIAISIALAASLLLFFIFDLHQYFTLSNLRQSRELLLSYTEQHFVLSLGIYFFVYIAVTALSLPGAAIMTLAGGAVFGLFIGVVATSFASSIGATLAFVVSRYLFRGVVEARFKSLMDNINRGIKREGAFYLFALRLVPAFPFFAINLVMGITSISAITFYWVSQLGMLPGTIAYVYAGTQLTQIDKVEDILTPGVLAAFAVLGLLPLVSKRVLAYLRARKAFSKYEKPNHFDYNAVVIGAGSAGLVSAYICAALKARVALIEKSSMGGDCLNTGCVPSKALIRSAGVISYANRAREFGLNSLTPEFDFSQIMERVQTKIAQIAPHDSRERYTELGVDCITGEARICDPFRVEVAGKTITTKNIIVATGAKPTVPDIPGLDELEYFTSETIWNLRSLPQRLLVLGGGPIGCELAQCFARFGSQVTIMQRGSRLLPKDEPEASEAVLERFEQEGIKVLCNYEAAELRTFEGSKQLRGESKEGRPDINCEFDALLVAVGRSARVQGFGLEELGVAVSERKTVWADKYMKTNIPNIYVCGDVTGPYQLTHAAGHQAWFAAVNALLSPFYSFTVDYSALPWCTFTAPEVARVGLSESQAKRQGISFEVTKYEIGELDRAIVDSEAHGFVKVLTRRNSDRILGATIVGSHAGELIAEYVLAMKHRIGLKKILGTVHIYPTMAEANKYAAGTWRRSHAPQRTLKALEWFHRQRRRDNTRS